MKNVKWQKDLKIKKYKFTKWIYINWITKSKIVVNLSNQLRQIKITLAIFPLFKLTLASKIVTYILFYYNFFLSLFLPSFSTSSLWYLDLFNLLHIGVLKLIKFENQQNNR